MVKNCWRPYVIILTLLLTTSISNSQSVHSISLGPELGIPLRNFGEASPCLGGSLEYQLRFKAPIGLQAHIGYLNFSARQEQFTDYRISFLPIRAGAVAFLLKDQAFVAAEAGVSKCHSRYSKDQTGFSFAFVLGYKWRITHNQFIMLSASANAHNYQNKQFDENFYYTWYAIRLAYGLNWGKRKSMGS